MNRKIPAHRGWDFFVKNPTFIVILVNRGAKKQTMFEYKRFFSLLFYSFLFYIRYIYKLSPNVETGFICLGRNLVVIFDINAKRRAYMYQILKRLITPLALLLTVSTHAVNAEAIRLLGPDGNLQSAPEFSQSVGGSGSAQNEPASYYGPTTTDETLWSIASKLRPNRQVSVQQTLLAIYKLNPQAFAQQNIHELVTGSRLRVPSLDQVRAESTQEAVRLLNIHKTQPVETAVVAKPLPKPVVIEETDVTSTPATEGEAGG